MLSFKGDSRMKPFLFFTVIVLGLSFTSSFAGAQTQSELNQEANDAFKKADDALNVTYQKLIALLDDQAKVKLKAAEREWVKFRDAESDFESDQFRGGSILPMMRTRCATRLTEARTADLAAQVRDRKSP